MSIINNAKEIAELVKKLGNIELYRKIVELEGDIIELTREKHDLEIRIGQLEAQLKVKGQLQFERGVYWLIEGERKDGPFCQQCYDITSKLIHLQDWGDVWACLACKSSYEK